MIAFHARTVHIKHVMYLAIIAIVTGLFLLVWSADKFVAGSAALARLLGLPALVIGMVVVGYGTSAPEMLVSVMSSMQGHPEIALGNAYGSNICNIALILGVTALISPIVVASKVLKKELPLLLAVSIGSYLLLLDGSINRSDALLLLGAFVVIMGWAIWQGFKTKQDAMQEEFEHELESADTLSRGKAILYSLVGLAVLIGSSRLLVWGAVEVAKYYAVSDLVIGLTVVAIGTSLPELASSIMAARRKEHDIALGNIVGSNLFNSLAVVGLAGLFNTLPAAPELLLRDLPILLALTVALFLVGFGFKKPGVIQRWEGALLLGCFCAYTAWLIITAK